MLPTAAPRAWLGLILAGAFACAGGTTVPPVTPAPSPPPAGGPPAPILSGNLPLSVSIPAGVDSPEEARPFFDSFSWQSFLALNWPAAPGGRRGEPSRPNDPQAFLQADPGAPVVWGTYKESFELFDQGTNRPAAWEAPNTSIGVCPQAPAGQKVFARFTKADSVVEIENQAFSYPLIDQSLNYTVYQVAFNRTQYEFIRGADNDPASWLYLVKNLAAKEPLSMPASQAPSTQGALMVKAAWKVLDPAKDNPTRFYTITAQVYDPTTQTCSSQQVGLVGFHIVQKLAAFPEWIWSTFEQVDNVPAPGAAPGGHYSFNNGQANPPTAGGYADRPPFQAPKLQPRSQRKPVQVSRLNAIPESTAALNPAFQKLVAGTPWQHYQLVFTQWPTQPQQFTTLEDGGIYPQDSGAAFPVNGVTNTVMETYFQSQNDAAGAGGNSCMSCHYRAGQADFSWSLLRGAH
jgi:hypothetical protein